VADPGLVFFFQVIVELEPVQINPFWFIFFEALFADRQATSVLDNFVAVQDLGGKLLDVNLPRTSRVEVRIPLCTYSFELLQLIPTVGGHLVVEPLRREAPAGELGLFHAKPIG
jgi:hypothetical protein